MIQPMSPNPVPSVVPVGSLVPGQPVISPRDPATGLPTGKRQIIAILIGL